MSNDNKQKPADLVLQNGFVYTVDQNRSEVEAIAVANKKIVYVGDNQGVKAFIGPDTTVLNLDGKMVLPGFIDSHAHVSCGVTLVEAAELFGESSLEGLQKVIREFATKNDTAEIIFGWGWINELFPPQGPCKTDLDAIISDRPVSMVSHDGHAAWVNSIALKKAGIIKDTPDPTGGVIERDPDTGEPSGTLRETAIDLIHNTLPAFSIEQMKEGISAYTKIAAKDGITTSHDPHLILPGDSSPMLGAGVFRHNIEAFSQLVADGELSVRIRGSVFAAPENGVSKLPAYNTTRDNHHNSMFQTRSIKIYVDGVIEGGTGFLLDAYDHKPGFRSEALWNPEDLNKVCQHFDKENYQIHVHAIGDAATKMTLDAFEIALQANGQRDSRHSITHLQLVEPEDIRRMARLNIIGIPQPLWNIKGEYYDKLALPYLGKERADNMYPMKTLIDAGVRLASASDFPVTVPCPPLLGIMTGITRIEEGVIDENEILGPGERLSLEEMIASFTINGAYANFLENETGSLEVGKLADMVVLDKNLFDIPASEINQAKVLLTLFEGQMVHGDETSISK